MLDLACTAGIVAAIAMGCAVGALVVASRGSVPEADVPLPWGAFRRVRAQRQAAQPPLDGSVPLTWRGVPVDTMPADDLRECIGSMVAHYQYRIDCLHRTISVLRLGLRRSGG
jgi:hypothetical protein